jgi:nucleoside-diphosphate-sugar epimerase
VRYLVTGGAGFIGSALTRHLVGAGHEVTVLDDASRGRWDRLDGVPCLEIAGDIRDPDDVRWALSGCDAVVHLAYMQGTARFYSQPREVLDVALRGMLTLLDACGKFGVRDLLFVSSSEAYQTPPVVPTPEDVPLSVPDVLNPRFSYGGGKIACELAALAWHWDGLLDRVIIARPHNVTGPDMGRDHVIPQFCLRMNDLVEQYPDGVIPFPIQGSGEETRSFCWIGDATAQLALLLQAAPAGGSVFHVGTESERTVAAAARAVAACYRRKIEVIPGALAEGSPPRRAPDTRKIRALGPLPDPLPFSQIVARTAAWYREHGDGVA